jgi:predicted nucleotide-binding protein
MALPIRTVPEDIEAVCSYLSKKPTGASIAEARKVLDPKHLDGRKISAFKFWGLVDESGEKLKVTPDGRAYAAGDSQRRADLLRAVISRIEPYITVIERAFHRQEESISATDLAAHWHEHFPSEVGDTDKTLNDQAVCFFQVAAAAGLGEIIVGRHGMPTRLQFEQNAIRTFSDSPRPDSTQVTVNQDAIAEPVVEEHPIAEASPRESEREAESGGVRLGQGIFIAHGKNKKPLEQLRKILDQFKIPYRVAIEEPNLGRPIGAKVKETMEACNCAVLIFTADEEFKKPDGITVWRPSENVVYELGAASYLYSNRVVIVKESGVEFPTNFRDLGYIDFEKDNLEAKSMDVLKELIGFGIVRVSV